MHMCLGVRACLSITVYIPSSLCVWALVDALVRAEFPKLPVNGVGEEFFQSAFKSILYLCAVANPLLREENIFLHWHDHFLSLGAIFDSDTLL